jgi:hypothetical protein
MSFDVLDAVQEFVEYPEENFGFMIVNTRKTQEVDFYSSEYTNEKQRPKLTITYDAATGVMPAAVAVAGTVRQGVTLQPQHRDLHLDGSAVSLAVTFTVSRPDGKKIYSGSIAPGGHAVVPGLGAGVYFVFIREKDRRNLLAVTILP